MQGLPDDEYEIMDLNDFQESFLNILRVIAHNQKMPVLSDDLFQVEIPSKNNTQYSVELFKKIDFDSIPNATDGLSHLVTMKVLDPALLVLLDEDNFDQVTGLGFDIRNRSQLRNFVAELHSVKARIRNLQLLSFDSQELTSCQSWNIDVSFDFGDRVSILVKKFAEYSLIACKSEWQDFIYYSEEEVEVKMDLRVAKAYIGNVFFWQFVLDYEHRYVLLFVSNLHENLEI